MPNATASAKPASVVQSVTNEFLASGSQYLGDGDEYQRGRGKNEGVHLEMRQASLTARTARW